MGPAVDEELVVIAPKKRARIDRAADIGRRTVIAFAAGCSYRRRLEEWLGDEGVVASQVRESGSYHAIIACVSAGAGIAIVPRSVLKLTDAGKQVEVSKLPARTA